ncbi:MAG: hypothetical protein Q9190_001931 [Brigantiaea leucoxantha]
MSCETAKRWFVPDAEYDAMTEDYALVNKPAVSIQRTIKNCNNGEYFALDLPPQPDPPETFADLLNRNLSHPCYPFASDMNLVYMDVDEADPSHKQSILNRIVEEPDLEEESETTKAMRKNVVSQLAAKYSEKYAEGEEDQLELEEYHEELLEDTRGYVAGAICKLLVATKDANEKTEILNMISGQTKRKTKRPVMALVAMIENGKKEPGRTEGWRIGYDFVLEQIHVKPFTSANGDHPLSLRWEKDSWEGKPCFCGTPAEFVDAYIEFGDSVASKDSDSISEEEAYTMLVYLRVMNFILNYLKGASSPEAIEKARETGDNIYKAMKNKKGAFEMFLASEAHCLSALKEMQAILENQEDALRDDAVKAKADGNDVLAEEAAQLFEDTLERLKSLNAK